MEINKKPCKFCHMCKHFDPPCFCVLSGDPELINYKKMSRMAGKKNYMTLDEFLKKWCSLYHEKTPLEKLIGRLNNET